MLRARPLPVALLMACAALTGAGAGSANGATTTLVSSIPANGSSFVASSQPAISADGRFIAYRTELGQPLNASNVPIPAIVRYDVATGEQLVVSRNSAGELANDESATPSISADGQFVAFSSKATNLSTSDTNGVRDVYVRNVSNATTTLVSRATGTLSAVGGAASTAPSISANGRFIAFESDANSFSDKDGTAKDVFVRDTTTLTTTLVSRMSGIDGIGGNQASSGASISADGNLVAFESLATQLTAGDTNGTSDVFVRDVSGVTTDLISRASGVNGAIGDGFSGDASISSDGKLAAFESSATNLAAGGAGSDVYLRDRTGNTTSIVAASASDPAIAGTGDVVVFQSLNTFLDPGFDRDALGPHAHVYTFTRATGNYALIDRTDDASGGGVPADGGAVDPVSSADGTRIAFPSNARNLSDQDADEGGFDADTDVFLRDLAATGGGGGGGGGGATPTPTPTPTPPLGPAPTATPVVTTAPLPIPTATPTVPPGAGEPPAQTEPPLQVRRRLKGRTLTLRNVALKHRKAGKCPKSATVRIRATTRVKGRTRIRSLRRKGKVTLVGGRCRLTLKATMPSGTRSVKITVTGKRLKTTRLSVKRS